MPRCYFAAENEDDTRHLGVLLAQVLPGGTTVALVGTQGGGKTRLVKAIAEACGVASDAVVRVADTAEKLPDRVKETIKDLEAVQPEFRKTLAEGRGIVELADLVVVNKSDGDLVAAANHAAAEYRHALTLLRPPVEGWQVPVLQVSAVEKRGIGDVWQAVGEYRDAMTGSGACVFLPVADRLAGEDILARCPPTFTGIVAQGMNTHPIHRILEGKA